MVDGHYPIDSIDDSCVRQQQEANIHPTPKEFHESSHSCIACLLAEAVSVEQNEEDEHYLILKYKLVVHMIR